MERLNRKFSEFVNSRLSPKSAKTEVIENVSFDSKNNQERDILPLNEPILLEEGNPDRFYLEMNK